MAESPTYVASQFSPSGHYSSFARKLFYPSSGKRSSSRVWQMVKNGFNGLYKYPTTTTAFPSDGYLHPATIG